MEEALMVLMFSSCDHIRSIPLCVMEGCIFQKGLGCACSAVAGWRMVSVTWTSSRIAQKLFFPRVSPPGISMSNPKYSRAKRATTTNGIEEQATHPLLKGKEARNGRPRNFWLLKVWGSTSKRVRMECQCCPSQDFIKTLGGEDSDGRKRKPDWNLYGVVELHDDNAQLTKVLPKNGFNLRDQ